VTEFTIINKKKSHYVNRKLILQFRESALSNIVTTSIQVASNYWKQFTLGNQEVGELLYHSLVIASKCFGFDFKQILTPEDSAYNDEIYVRLYSWRDTKCCSILPSGASTSRTLRPSTCSSTSWATCNCKVQLEPRSGWLPYRLLAT
jgi:hypothetical protein